jgi:hypothetical protein
VFNEMTPTGMDVSLVVRTLLGTDDAGGGGGGLPAARELFERMPRGDTLDETAVVLMSVYTGQRDPAGALAVFASYTARGGRAYAAHLQALRGTWCPPPEGGRGCCDRGRAAMCAARRWGEARRMVARLSDDARGPPSQPHEVLARAYADAGMAAEARTAFLRWLRVSASETHRLAATDDGGGAPA